MALPGGGAREWEFDALLRPARITGKDPAGNPVLDYAYTFDPVGNILGKQTEHGAYIYGYDDLDRLTRADNPSLPDEAYTYDPVGNRLTDAKTTGTWAYSDSDELKSYGDISLHYDLNGSLKEKNENGTVVRYVYNLENRLAEVRDGANELIASYYYDPFGRRLWKDVGGSRTYFLYADEGLIAEANSSGTITRQYGWQPGGAWGADPLYLKADGQTYFYQNDHLGTPQKLVGPNGALMWGAKYESFGTVHTDVAQVGSALRFPGQYFDAETEAHYNYYRYYEPLIGRYDTSDPLGLVGGSNSYLYVVASPHRHIDVLGLAIWICNRDVTGFPFVGNHAYLWDDRTGTPCGMNSSSGTGPTGRPGTDLGPQKDSCTKVMGSDGKEDDVMKCCNRDANNGVWTPGINDCHNAANDCIEESGLKTPGAPGGRVGQKCDSNGCDEEDTCGRCVPGDTNCLLYSGNLCNKE
jgi:RHS repeat-associated protein